MDPRFKVVTQLPLQELWRDGALVSVMRQGTLDEEGISNLLRVGPVIFAVADVGLALRWIDPGERYQFWKEEVKAHLAASDCASLDGYPDGYYYFASHWSSKEESATIVLLEKCH